MKHPIREVIKMIRHKRQAIRAIDHNGKENIPDDPANLEDVESIEQAIDAFAEAMKIKMILKAEQGRKGWDDPANEEGIKQALIEHVFKDGPQWVDVANFAMMLWYFKIPKERK